MLILGKKFTKEHVRKIALGNNGKHYNKNTIPQIQSHKRKISITRKKYVMTKEYRAKSKALKVHKDSEEIKRKMSESHKDKPKSRKHSNNNCGHDSLHLG